MVASIIGKAIGVADSIGSSVDKSTSDQFGLGGSNFSISGNYGTMFEDLFSGQKKTGWDYTKDILSILAPGFSFRKNEIDKGIKDKLYRTKNYVSKIQNAPDSLLGMKAGAYGDIKNKQEKELNPEMLKRLENRRNDTGIASSIIQLGSTATSLIGGGDKIEPRQSSSISSLSPKTISDIIQPSINPQSIDNPMPKLDYDIGGDLPGENVTPSFDVKDTSKYMKSGGSNKGGAVPIEAEGGEIEVEFDEGYNVKNVVPIHGPSHEGGGVDRVLPKNHAILNKEQQARLRSGESLKSILDTIPDVNTGKAVEGYDNSNPEDHKWYSGFKYAYPNAENNYWGLTHVVPQQKKVYPSRLSKPKENYGNAGIPGENNEIGILNKRFDFKGDKKSILDNIALSADNTTNDATGIDTKGQQKTSNDSVDFGEYKPSIINPSLKGDNANAYLWDSGFKEGIEPIVKEGFDWKDTLDDVSRIAPSLFGNLAALLQKDPTVEKVKDTNLANPVFFSPRKENPEPYLNNLNKQFNSLISYYNQTGQREKIPALISQMKDAHEKIQEGISGQNAKIEDSSMAQATGAQNQFSLEKARLDADRIAKQLNLDMSMEQIKGAKEGERIKAGTNLLALPEQLKRMKEDEAWRNQMRNYASMQMFWPR